MRQLDHYLSAGADVIQIAANKAPAGLSPAADEWDPYWARLAEAGVPVLFHLGSHLGFFDDGMQNTPRLRAVDRGGAGEGQGPYGLMTMHLAIEAYLTAMIYGGVFERHPGLRVGVIELGGGWVSGWVERLDHQLEYFAKALARNISLTPSDYVRRNIRITPFYKEPVGRYVQRDGLDDVYVFSTDYPHAEGGTDPIEFFHGSLVDVGCTDEQIEKFFVRNGELILPPR
jgi:predicted TIM-barrel fold metal-dependent hydrolase